MTSKKAKQKTKARAKAAIKKAKAKTKIELPPFDKYYYYHSSVQNPDSDIEYLTNAYKELRGKDALIFREDFCGTFANCCKWVSTMPERTAIGVDLDPEPIEYGRKNYFSKLNEEQQSRITILEENVLNDKLPKADLVCALNFSYNIFKERKVLKEYFSKVLTTLNDDGVFVLDIFGGSQCYEANEEETEYTDAKYSYFWDQKSFNPINSHALFNIHFKRKGEAKREGVFVYDWRLWTIAELRDLLDEAGFKSSHVYWEGTTKDGEGDGEFSITEQGEECDSWVAYIAACK